MTEYSISEKLMDRVKSTLKPGENIDWLGKPIPRYLVYGGMGGLIFGLPFTAFNFFLLIIIASRIGFSLVLLFLIPFFLFGFVFLSAPIWVHHNWKKNAYIVTNKRAIRIYHGRYTGITQSFYPNHLQDIYTKMHKDGSGDVIVTCQALRDSSFANTKRPLGFLQVQNPKQVEKRLKKLAGQSAEADVK